MKGCIVKKKGRSTYSIVIELGRDESGKRKQKWFNGYKTKKEAEKELIKILNQFEENSGFIPEKITLGEYLKNWMKEYVELNLAVKTIEGYRVNVEKHIIPSLGKIQLQKLQPLNIQQFYNEKLKNGRVDGKGGLSPKSILYIHRVLRKALQQAVKLQLINKNPADFVEVPKQKGYKASFLDEEQVQKYLKAFSETNLYIPVLLGIGLGLRRGEALGVQWKDINFNSKTVTISRSLLPSGKGLIFHEPKTESSTRTISIPDFVLEELQRHKEQQEDFKRLLGAAYKENDLICCYADGTAINPASFSHMFERAQDKHGLLNIRFHDLRHTNATLMLKSKVPPKVAAERLGHSSIGITMDLYSHVMKEMQEEAANKISNILNQNNDSKS